MQNKKIIILVITAIAVIAGLADLKYRGLFFQSLPASIQKRLAGRMQTKGFPLNKKEQSIH